MKVRFRSHLRCFAISGPFCLAASASSAATVLLRSAGKSCGSAQRIGVQQFAVQHYYPRLPQIGNSRRRVAFHQHKVGGLTYFDGAGFLVHLKETRRCNCCSGQSFGVGQTCLVVDFQFADNLDAGAVPETIGTPALYIRVRS